MNKYLFVLSLLVSTASFGQEDEADSGLTVSGYAEVYYIYDFNKPADNTRPGFIYSHNRHNEVALNLGMLKASYSAARVRGNLALMAGTYANANLGAEPGVLKNIYEANVGVKLSAKKELWVDAGIFPSHIGFESAIGKDCATLTRSLMAENSPYYEAGAKLSYTSDNSKWFLSALVLNGWQRMQRVDGNSLLSFGTQITFMPGDRWTINSSTFIGADTPDAERRMRYFHDLYVIAKPSDKLAITAGLDIGGEEKSVDDSDLNTWWTAVAIVQVAVSEKWKVAARGEYYDDAQNVIVASPVSGFKTSGVSVNADHQFTDHLVWRVEVRGFFSPDPVFEEGGGFTDNNVFAGTSLALSF